MLKIGVTGGIGSGKSTICRIFESFRVPVYYADERAQMLIENHPAIIEAYKELFGDGVYKRGKLNRQLVAQQVFSDKTLLSEVNKVVHPEVRNDFLAWMETKSESPYIIQEAAILLESGGYRQMDEIVLVSAPEEVRIERVMNRDNISRNKVLDRIKNQWSDQQRRPFCDFEVMADDKHLVVPQVIELHTEFLK